MAKSHRVTADALKAEVAALKQQLPDQEAAEREQLAALQLILAALPNLPAADVPDGEDEAGNVEIARWGTLRDLDFQPPDQADCAPALGPDYIGRERCGGGRGRTVESRG